MATYNIDGYRIVAKSRNQALEAARQLKQSNATQGSWPGEHNPHNRIDDYNSEYTRRNAEGAL